MSQEVELRAIRYTSTPPGQDRDDSYRRDPYKFLWTYSGEKAKEKNIITANSSRVHMVWEHAQGKKILGKVLVMRPTGLPKFGSIYQESGSNFILHGDNITRVLKIPYFPKATQTKVVSPCSWYLDSIYWTFYIFNLMNLIFSAVALIYFVKDTYYFFFYFSSAMNPMKTYMALFLFLIISVAFIFSIGHSISATHSLALLYLYIFLTMSSIFVMGFFQAFFSHREALFTEFIRDLEREFILFENMGVFDRLQEYLQCCGVTDSCDWEVFGHELLPNTCCPAKTHGLEWLHFDCPYNMSYHESCGDAVIDLIDNIMSRHSYMLWGKIIFQWLAIIMAMIYAIALYNGGFGQKNNINYHSAVPVEYFNIVTKGEVEFCLPLSYYHKEHTDDYKYMVLLSDIRQAVNLRQMKYFHEKRYMMFDVV